MHSFHRDKLVFNLVIGKWPGASPWKSLWDELKLRKSLVLIFLRLSSTSLHPLWLPLEYIWLMSLPQVISQSIFATCLEECHDPGALRRKCERTYFNPPSRGWQRNKGLLLLHSFLSSDILIGLRRASHSRGYYLKLREV